MSHEIVYTSAPQGLKAGSYGFCTVMATAGMSKILQDRLESLSGYEHPFSLTDRRAHLNPVNFSHLIVTIANQRYHLLSRVADAGADYSGRSNKFAHHVALSPNERTPADPAWTLNSGNFCKTSFDGQPRELQVGVLPPAASRPFAKCLAWEQLTKDAGWAGVLAELTIKYPTRPVTLIFTPGTDLLPLVVEAMSLLPADRQWRTTFSTFFTKLPTGIDCQWRFVMEGTPAADAARRNLQSPPIDLSAPGPLPLDSPLVTAARSDHLPISAPTTSAIAPPASKAPGSISSLLGLRSAPTPNTAESLEPGTYAVSGHAPPGAKSRHTITVGDLTDSRPRSRFGLAWAIVAGVLFMGTAVGLAIHFGRRQELALPGPGQPSDSGPRRGPPALANADIEKPDFLVKPDEKAPPQTRPDEPPKTMAAITPVEVSSQATPKNDKPKKTGPPKHPFEDIEGKGLLLALPKRDQGGIGVTSVTQVLCKLFVEHAETCELTLTTNETITIDNEDKPRLFLKLGDKPIPGSRTWQVLSLSNPKKNALAQVETPKPVPVAEFNLYERGGECILEFKWIMNSQADESSPFGVTLCKLDLTVGKETKDEKTVRCSLFKPIDKISPGKLDLTKRNQKLPLEVKRGTLASTDTMRVDLEILFEGRSYPYSEIVVGGDSLIRLELPKASSHGNGKVEIEFELIPPDATHDAELKYRTYLFPEVLVFTGSANSTPNPQTTLPPPPQMQRQSKRCDELDKQFKDGFIKTDFGIVQKLAEGKTKQIKDGDLPRHRTGKDMAEKRIRITQKDLGETRQESKRPDLNAQEQDVLDKKVRRLQGEILDDQKIQRWHEDWLEFLQGPIQHKTRVDDWIREMRERFNEIQDNLEVRFSVYLDYGDEKVVLSATNPLPKKKTETEDSPKRGKQK